MGRRGVKFEKITAKFPGKWALCSWRSHGTKSTMLESKLRTGASKTKKMQIYLDEVALFWMSQWTACSPAWRILYHVTASCKGPLQRRSSLLIQIQERDRTYPASRGFSTASPFSMYIVVRVSGITCCRLVYVPREKPLPRAACISR